MSCSSPEDGLPVSPSDKKYKGVRRRKWGKWVSEIRVPITQQRLWLGSYSTPEAAAVAHDVAYYCLRRPTTLEALNFPLLLPSVVATDDMSPSSIQKVASDAGMAVDAQFVSVSDSKARVNHVHVEENNRSVLHTVEERQRWPEGGVGESSWSWVDGTDSISRVDHQNQPLSISVDDYMV